MNRDFRAAQRRMIRAQVRRDKGTFSAAELACPDCHGPVIATEVEPGIYQVIPTHIEDCPRKPEAGDDF